MLPFSVNALRHSMQTEYGQTGRRQYDDNNPGHFFNCLTGGANKKILVGHLPHQWKELPHQCFELAHQKLC